MRRALSDRLDLLAQKIRRVGAVFDVDAHGADLQDIDGEPCHRARIIRIAGLDVDAERHPNCANDVASRGNQSIARECIAVGIPARPRKSRAGRRNRLRSQAFDQARAACIPGIGQHE
jgi:hypothetical protein